MNIRNALLLAILTLATTALRLAAQGPTIVDVRRDKGFPNATDQVTVTFVARSNGSPLDPATARICYDVAFDDVMTSSDCLVAAALNDSTFTATIPAQKNDSYVRYWASIADSNAQTTLLPADTLHYKYFYKIFSTPPTIYDVEYTPNVGGTGGYAGFDVTFTAIVTADINDIPGNPNAPGGADPLVTIQQGENSPWIGIALRVRDSNGNVIPALTALRRGDSVTVSGRLNENHDKTVIENATEDSNFGLAKSQPQPFHLST
jgi:hypothetical protein